MRQRRDDPAESAPDEAGISPGDPDGRGSDPDRGSRPLLGGYYWLPTPAPTGSSGPWSPVGTSVAVPTPATMPTSGPG